MTETTESSEGGRPGFPVERLVGRLRELAQAVTQGPDAVRREMTMRVPAEPDRDADLVLCAAADELEVAHVVLAGLLTEWHHTRASGAMPVAVARAHAVLRSLPPNAQVKATDQIAEGAAGGSP